MSDTPSLLGFIREVAPWLTPILGVLLGKAMKSGVNESRLDTVCRDAESQQKQISAFGIAIENHTTRIGQMERNDEAILRRLDENSRLLGTLVGQVGRQELRESRTYPTLPSDR